MIIKKYSFLELLFLKNKASLINKYKNSISTIKSYFSVS